MAIPKPQSGSASWADVIRETNKEKFWRIAPLLALIYSVLLLPPEIQVSLAGLKITGYRVVILCFVLFSVIRLFQRSIRLSLADIAVTLSCAWVLLSFQYIYGPFEGLVRGGAVVLDAMGAYLIARTAIASHNDLRRVLILVAPVLAISGLILMIESIFSTLLFRPSLARIFGSVSAYSGGEASGALTYMTNTRFGLMRGYAGFSHPILAGVTLASVLPLYFLSGLRSWPKYLGIGAAFMCIFSMSSIAFLALMICVAFLLTDWVKDYFRLITWPLITAGMVVILTVAHLVADNGIFRFIIRYTFSPHNGRVRLIQWEAGANSMAANPWFGVGYEPIFIATWLPSSLDAHFLMVGVRSGWFATIMLLAACILVMIALGSSIARSKPSERNLIVGLNMTIGLLIVASMTVAYYAETNIFFMAVLGIGSAVAGLQNARLGQGLGARPLRAPSAEDARANLPRPA